MNERKQLNDTLREIAKNAKVEHCISHERLRDFADLIVAECITKIETEAAQYAEPVWAFELVNDIKEHFGANE